MCSLSVFLCLLLNYGNIIFAFQLRGFFQYKSYLKHNVLSGIQPDFSKLLEHAEKTSSYTEAISAVQEYISSNEIIPNSRAITTCIKIYGQAALVDDALSLLTISQAKGMVLNVFHYNTCLQVCCKHKYYTQALSLFNDMKSKEIVPDGFTYSTMFAIFGQMNNLEQIKRLITTAPRNVKDTVFYSSALSGLEKCSNSSPEESELIWETMREEGIQPGVNAYASLMRIYKDVNPSKSYAYFQLCEKNHQSPSKVMVLNLLEILKQSNQFDLFQDIKQKYAVLLERPKDYEYKTIVKKPSFNELISSAKQTGNFTHALLYADNWLATQKNLSPGGVTSCITIYGLAKQPGKAMQILHIMKQKDIIPNSKHYNAIMTCLLRSGLHNDTISIFNTIPINLRDSFSYGILLNVYEKQKDWETALTLFTTTLPHLQIPRTTVIYNTMMSCLGKSKKWEKAYEIFQDLVKNGIPDKVSFLSILSILDQNNQPELSAYVRANYMPVNDQTSVADNNGEQSIPKTISAAGSLQNKLMEQEGGGLFQLLKSMGELQKCVDILRESEESGVLPHISHCTSVIRYYGEVGDWQQAILVYERMKSLGVKADQKFYSLLLHILNEYADDDTIRRVAQDCQTQGLQIPAVVTPPAVAPQ